MRKILLSMLYKGDILSIRSRILFDICQNLRTNSVFSVSILCWFDRFDAQKFFFPFPFIADLIEVRDKSFFFPFPIIADLIDVSYKSIFFRLQSFLIWLPFARKVVFSVSNHCWFDCHLQEKFFFPFLFAADFCNFWTCVLYLIWLSDLLKYIKIYGFWKNFIFENFYIFK